MSLARLCFVATLALAVPASSHELWIAPLEYQADSGGNLQAHFRNGEGFEGTTLSYFDQRSTRFEMIVNGDTTKLTPRPGDKPAFTLPDGTPDGLIIVAHETTSSSLTYRDWEKFLKFAAHKDFADAGADHIAAGWPQDKFKESYTRHIKALMTLGDGAGSDQTVGMATEFTALTNPYAPDFDGQMQVALTYQDAPRPDAQVEVFDRAPDDTVTITLHRTDADGRATIPVTPGHEYLFDAVVLRPADNPDADPEQPLWETLWAALTFKVPAR
ncbi:DUF4198 domain-containing protein [Sulfitobacter sp. JB4-11]|uniref:DUF4198 domain-containing protein n=1 Tax=Sulfitobacter rhodophyticola TaxID=3238304 RepID=UPI003D818FB4